MSRYAIISGGHVVNVAVGDAEWAAAVGAVQSDVAQIGWAYADGVFTAPPPPDPGPQPVPASITRRQLLLQLALTGMISGSEALAAAQTGAVPAAVQAAFDQLGPSDRLAAEITWATMSVADRGHPLVAALAATRAMTDQQIDDFFRAAAAL